MDKTEIINQFDILLETIKKALEDDNYKESFDFLNNFNKFLTDWKKDYSKTNSLINIDSNKLNHFKLESSDFFVKHEEYDLEDNCFTEIITFHFNILLKYWKSELNKGGI